MRRSCARSSAPTGRQSRTERASRDDCIRVSHGLRAHDRVGDDSFAPIAGTARVHCHLCARLELPEGDCRDTRGITEPGPPRGGARSLEIRQMGVCRNRLLRPRGRLALADT